MSSSGDKGYIQTSVRLQNEIISGIIMDVDKLRSMILEIYNEHNHIKRTFLGPQLVMPKAPSRPTSVPMNVPAPRRNIMVKRPVSVPTSVPNKLPKIVIPRPPTASRPPSRAPRRAPDRPILVS